MIEEEPMVGVRDGDEIDEESNAKKVPVVICLDTTEGMLEIWDEEIVSATKSIYRKHKDHSKLAPYAKTQRVPLDLMFSLFFDEYPDSVRSRYGGTKEEIRKRKMDDIPTGANQSRNILRIFFETLRSEHDNQKSIDVEVCVITFSDGKTDILIPFSGPKIWNDVEWIKKLGDMKIEYKGHKKKTMLMGLYKATELLEERIEYYKEKHIDNIRGRIVLLTKPTLSQEDKNERRKLKNLLETSLEEYRNIPVVLGKGKNQVNNMLGGIEFPEGMTQFINSGFSNEQVEEIFKKISQSVSAGSANVDYDIFVNVAETDDDEK